jgi:5-methyltetrahydrofolate--homocysteine methyltransferase
VKDASKSVAVVSSLLSKEQKRDYTQGIKEEYEALRESYAGAGRDIKYLSLEEARRNRFRGEWSSQSLFKPKSLGIKILNDYSLKEISKYINWIFFFTTWELKGKFPDIFEHPKYGREARKLYEDALEMLDKIISEKWLQANGVYGIFPASSVGDDIVIYDEESARKELTRFTMLRNQTQKESQVNLCLSDFVAPADSGHTDYLGAFAVTAGIGIEEKLKEFEADHDDYSSIMLKALADRLAEAFTELLHQEIRKYSWGYAPDEALEVQDLFREQYSGIRPAHGYPACPDHSEKEVLFSLLEVEKHGILLTENYSMVPAASVSGLIFAHPESRYFFVGKIGIDQVKDYARRKNLSVPEVESLLASNLAY